MSQWRRVFLWLLLSLGLIAAVSLVRHFALCGAPITTDEGSYVFQAYNFMDGRIARRPPPYPDIFFHRMIIMDEKAGWLSRYPPGHPLWLLPGCLIGAPYVMVALAAALSLWLIARTALILGSRPAQAAAAAMLLLSPFYLFTHGTLLSHTSGLLAVSILLYGFVRWQETDSVRHAALAGFGWGWLWLNRTYTATWMAVPFALYALLRLFIRRREKTAWHGTLVFAGVCAIGFAAIFLYNHISVGDFRTMTYLYYDPTDTVGFGTQHTLDRGLHHLRSNVALLDRWLLGFRGSLALAVLVALVGWRLPWTPLFLLTSVLVWGAHVFFYYPGPHEIGPGYYAETLPCLVLSAAIGVKRLYCRLQGCPVLRIGARVAVPVALAGVSIPFMFREGKALRTEQVELGEAMRVIAGAPRHALIFVEPHRHSLPRHGPIIFNPRGLKSRPLVLRSVDNFDPKVARLFPDRVPYRLKIGIRTGLVPLDTTIPYSVSVPARNMHNRVGARQEIPPDPTGETVALSAREDRDAPGWLAFGTEVHSSPGQFTAEFALSVSNAAPDRESVEVDVAVCGGRRVFVRMEVRGNTTGPLVLPYEADSADPVEPRVFYRGSGHVVFSGVRISDRPAPAPAGSQD